MHLQRLQITAAGHVVRFEDLIVSVFVLRVTDDDGTHIGMVAIETGCTPRYPARALDHLRSHVKQQILIILKIELSKIQPSNNGDPGEPAFEVKPDADEPAQRLLAQVRQNVGAIQHYRFTHCLPQPQSDGCTRH